MSQKQATIEKLFRNYHARMYRLASILLHDDEESKDAVSDVFARLMQREQLSEEDITENYLLTAVRNRCMDHLAHLQVRQRVERLIPVDNTVWISETNEELRYKEMRHFIDTELPEQTRQVFLLRFDGHKTYQEIAKAQDISMKTVYKHLHNAVTKLHEHFNTQEQ